jgi:hypothetical protein
MELSSAHASSWTRELMDKNADGTLSPEEGHELDRLVLLDDIIGLIQVHASGEE